MPSRKTLTLFTTTITLLSTLLLGLPTLTAATAVTLPRRATCQKYLTLATKAASSLQTRYFTEDGDYGPQAVWISGVDTLYLSKLDELSGSDHHNVIDTVFNSNMDYLLTGESYDDVAWIVMAYLKENDFANALTFYEISEHGVDDVCGGGLWWDGQRTFKNTITNVLFMSSSGLMYNATGEEKYLTALTDTWAWMKEKNLTNHDGLFNDALTRDGTCRNDNGTVWTYNQGAGLVGLGFLAQHDPSALDDAYALIDNMIEHMTVDGILREPCETETTIDCNADQRAFKGLTMFFLNWFLEITGKDTEKAKTYSAFIKAQADAIVKNASMGSGYYRPTWFANNKAENWDSSQSSALAAFLAAAAQEC